MEQSQSEFNVIRPTPSEWDSFVQSQNGHLLQTTAWGQLKSDFGWDADCIALSNGTSIVAGALVLFRQLPMRIGTIAYVPRGPVIDWQDTPLLEHLLDQLDDFARERDAVFLKVEPDLADSEENRALVLAQGFHLAPQTVQPPRTILIDTSLSFTEEDILSRMSQNTRRKVRLPYRREIDFRIGTEDDLESFNALVSVTGDRDKFGVHQAEYYERVYELFNPDHCALVMASHQGSDLAGLMVFRWGNRAWYLYGASSNEERNRMPTYGLQLEAIRWARETGCSTYDLWGIPDEDEETLEAEFKERSEGLWGVYGFKRGFGGVVSRSVGAWDRPFKPAVYEMYKAIVKWRR